VASQLLVQRLQAHQERPVTKPEVNTILNTFFFLLIRERV
jgi:hypothetical protein